MTQLVHLGWSPDRTDSMAVMSSSLFSTTASVQLLFHCHSLLRTLHDSANCETSAARHTWQLTDRGAADCYFDWRLVWIRAPSSPSADLRPQSKSSSLVNHSRPGDFWILTFVSLREPTGLSRPLARPAMTSSGRCVWMPVTCAELTPKSWYMAELILHA